MGNSMVGAQGPRVFRQENINQPATQGPSGQRVLSGLLTGLGCLPPRSWLLATGRRSRRGRRHKLFTHDWWLSHRHVPCAHQPELNS